MPSLNIFLEDETYERLRGEAMRRGAPVATVVREAIDRLLFDSARRAAGDRLLAAVGMPVEDWPEMKKLLFERKSDC
jgi:hypothetical protein